jgi:IS605 OrfB family transposase
MLDETASLLNAARAFYLHFFLAHAQKLAERVPYYSEKHLEMRERIISANELLTWAEVCTVETSVHPEPLTGWSFTERFPGMPFVYRRSVIKDAIGKVRSYLSNTAKWKRSGKKKGRPGLPGARDHPTLYQGTCSLQMEHGRFARIKVYDGKTWTWVNYPVKSSRYLQRRLSEEGWERKSPLLVLRAHSAELHYAQTKEITARRVRERRLDPNLVTVAVDLNVKQLAVITVRQSGTIIETLFVPDHGLDQRRYRYLKRIAQKQWQSGKPIKGEHSSQKLWQHVRRMNEDTAHKVARIIAGVCAKYPGCVLLFERLRKIRPKGGGKSARMNRKQANQLRGKINQKAREKAFAVGIVTVEVNPHGTSQYCSRCGLKGERFSFREDKRIKEPWGKLFWCPNCRYEAHADWNGSVNVHHSFYQEFHWQPPRNERA